VLWCPTLIGVLSATRPHDSGERNGATGATEEINRGGKGPLAVLALAHVFNIAQRKTM